MPPTKGSREVPEDGVGSDDVDEGNGHSETLEHSPQPGSAKVSSGRRSFSSLLVNEPLTKRLGTWERYGGFAGAAWAALALIVVLTHDPTIKVNAVVNHKTVVKTESLTSLLVIGLVTTAIMVWAAWNHRRGVLTITTVMLGLDLSYARFGVLALPYLAFAIWLMIRMTKVSKLDAQQKAQASGTSAKASGRAGSASSSRSSRPSRPGARASTRAGGSRPTGGPAESKRYTPPKARKAAKKPARPVGTSGRPSDSAGVEAGSGRTSRLLAKVRAVRES